MSAVTSELPSLLGNEGVACMFSCTCFLPTGEPSERPVPPFSPPERPVVVALKSVSNSWTGDTCMEKTGRAKVVWKNWALRKDRDQRAICCLLLWITGPEPATVSKWEPARLCPGRHHYSGAVSDLSRDKSQPKPHVSSGLWSQLEHSWVFLLKQSLRGLEMSNMVSELSDAYFISIMFVESATCQTGDPAITDSQIFSSNSTTEGTYSNCDK